MTYFCQYIYATDAITRSSKMRQQDITMITGSLTSSLSGGTRLTCQSTCLNNNCIYITVNKTSKICNFYGNGTEQYDVTGLQVYAAKQVYSLLVFLIAVIINRKMLTA